MGKYIERERIQQIAIEALEAYRSAEEGFIWERSGSSTRLENLAKAVKDRKDEITAIPDADVVCRDVYDRILAENDTMREQLAGIGKKPGDSMEDVQRVVLCKDCRHRPVSSGALLDGPDGDYTCPYLCFGDAYYNQMPEDDGFCDRGKAKE